MEQGNQSDFSQGLIRDWALHEGSKFSEERSLSKKDALNDAWAASLKMYSTKAEELDAEESLIKKGAQLRTNGLITKGAELRPSSYAKTGKLSSKRSSIKIGELD